MVQGFFGKLPSHGDFVRRELPHSFVDPWDEWLQHAVDASKRELGDEWLTTYLHSPLWRFVLMPGICGDSGWAGVLVPSVDRVGRYFPLTLAAQLSDGVRPFDTAASAEPWFLAIEELALKVLEQEQFEADALADAVAEITWTDDLVPDTPARLAGGEWGLRGMASGAAALRSTVAHELVQFQVGLFSLWWCHGDEETESMSLVAPGLPKPESFSRLLAGDWGEQFAAEQLNREPAPAAVPEEASTDAG